MMEDLWGTLGLFGAFSFNGNKIITTSGGGMLVSERKDLIDHARKLSTQARDPAPHYEHSEIGYNYRMSNILAAIGRGQLRVLKERVEKEGIYSKNTKSCSMKSLAFLFNLKHHGEEAIDGLPAYWWTRKNSGQQEKI